LELLIKELNDILECGIEANIENIGKLLLCEASTEPIAPASFVGATEGVCKTRVESLNV